MPPQGLFYLWRWSMAAARVDGAHPLCPVDMGSWRRLFGIKILFFWYWMIPRLLSMTCFVTLQTMHLVYVHLWITSVYELWFSIFQVSPYCIATNWYLFGRGFNQYVHTVSVIYTILSAWFDLTKIIWVFASTQSFMCYIVQNHLALYLILVFLMW